MRNADSEKVIEHKLSEAIKATGGYSIKLASPYVTGLPDRLCLLPPGRAIFVELKSAGQKPRKTQLLMHDKLRLLGFRVEVIDTLQGVYDFIESIKC